MSTARPAGARERRAFWIAFGLLAFMLAAGLGLREPWPADEPRFVLVARAMVESGDWLFLRRGIELYADKPPFYFWLQSLAFLVLRSWRISFLVPSLAAALCTLALTYDLVRRLSTRRAARLAMLGLGTTLMFAFQARTAQIDATLTFFVTLSCYGLLRHVLLGPAWRWYGIAAAAAGVGVVTKGVGFLPLLMLAPYAYARIRGFHGLAPLAARDWRWTLAPVLFVLPILLWLVPLVFAVKLAGDDPARDAYVTELVFRQTAERYAEPWHHAQPVWYFLQAAAWMWLPLVLALPWAVPAWRRRFAARRDARMLLPLAWVVLVFVFFSATPGKREVYVLPALPMFAVALAPLLPGLLRRRGPRLALWGTTLAFGLALFACGGWALVSDPAYEQRMLEQRALWPWALVATLGAVAIAAALVARPRRAPLAWLAFAFATWTLYGLWGYPAFDAARSARGVMARAGAMAGSRAELALVGWREQHLLQADRRVTEFGFSRPLAEQRAAALRWLAASPGRRRVVIVDEGLDACLDRARVRSLGVSNRRGWFLFGHDAVVAGCAAREAGTDTTRAAGSADAAAGAGR